MSTDQDRAQTRGTAPEHDLDRRSLLRRGGAALAGVAALGATGAAVASPAGAGAGDPVLQGAANDAGAATTSLTSSAHRTAVLANTSGGGVSLQLPDSTATFDNDVFLAGRQSGDLVNLDGDLLFTHNPDFTGTVYTDYWANVVVPITPQRVLDTKADRSNVTNPSGNIDSAGRLIAGHSITVDLAEYVFEGVAGLFNLTVASPATSGYLVMWPGGARPATSTVNFTAGQNIANFAVCGLTDDTVRIFAQQTTRVILDVTGFFAGGPWRVNPAVLPLAAAPLSGARAAAARPAPSWVRRPVG